VAGVQGGIWIEKWIIDYGNGLVGVVLPR